MSFVCQVGDANDRDIITLKIEKEALRKETDAASKERLERLEMELVKKEEEAAALMKVWLEEKCVHSALVHFPEDLIA